jgi:hypothetical protein
MQPNDLLVVLDAREIEQFDGNAMLLEHRRHPENAEAHEHSLVEEEA